MKKLTVVARLPGVANKAGDRVIENGFRNSKVGMVLKGCLKPRVSKLSERKQPPYKSLPIYTHKRPLTHTPTIPSKQSQFSLLQLVPAHSHILKLSSSNLLQQTESDISQKKLLIRYLVLDSCEVGEIIGWNKTKTRNGLVGPADEGKLCATSPYRYRSTAWLRRCMCRKATEKKNGVVLD